MVDLKEGQVNVDRDDLGLLLICAVRYSLGRRSYMPRLVMDLVRRYKDIISERDKKVIIDSIKDAHEFAMRATGGKPSPEAHWKEWLALAEELSRD